MRWHDPATSFLEGIFSRGDRRLAPVVERAYKKGAVFASWMEHFSLEPWLEAMAEEGLSPEAYQAAIPLDAPLAWGHLENGISREFLLREHANAMAGKTVNDCRYGVCLACGACDTKTPSLLPKNDDAARYVNALNFPQRDQNAHAPVLDAHGRVVPKDGWKKEEETPQGGKKRPPAISEHLAHKAMHLRLWYERKGLASYLSQLELQSLFERAMRRANIPLSFSQGFHPLPVLSFCRALPVGVSSEGEWLSIHLREHRDPAAVVAGLGTILQGLTVTDAEILMVNRRPAESEADTFQLAYIGNPARREAFMDAWRAIAGSDTIPWTRATKKGDKEGDVRDAMKKILFADADTCILQMSWENGYVSPLALVRAALAHVTADFALSEFNLTKLRV